VLIDTRTIELTHRFYEWELRGRGWARYPRRVALEPPFVPFQGYDLPSEARVDDARRATWFSDLVDRLKQGASSSSASPVPPPSEESLNVEPSTAGEVDFDEFWVALPAEAKVHQASVLGWLRSLAILDQPVAFELLGGDGRVEMRLASPAHHTGHVLSQLQAMVPSAVVIAAADPFSSRWFAIEGQPFAAVEFGLSAEFMVPLATRASGDEPLLPLVAALAEAGPRELGLYQVLFQAVTEPWERSVLSAVVTEAGKPFFADAPELTALAREKVATPFFAVSVRIAATADEAERAWELVARIASGLAHFGGPQNNEFMPLPHDNPAELEADLLDRATHRTGMLLSSEELLSLVQFPGAGVRVPGLARADERTKRAPDQTAGSGCLIGINAHHGQSAEVRLPDEARTKHVHVLGASGTGKSTLLLRMILEDIETGHGVGVLDPHGDLVEGVASRVPDHRLDDVVYFDPSTELNAVGWNILGARSEVEKDLLASDLVAVFRRLSTSWGDQMTAVLANAVLAFLESSQGGTLEDLRRFLVDPKYQKEFLATVADPHVLSFWQTEFPMLIGRKPQAPILTRLDTFLRSKLIRSVVAVRKPKLDFRDVTEGGKIFLGKLAAGAVGEENAALLGSLLVSKLHQVTTMREAQLAEERRPFFLYIDEFHHVATPSMASLFSGMRKYRLGLTVAHQDLYQLHSSVPEVERSLLSNAFTRIVFRVGDDDARQLARGFAGFEPEDFMRLGLGEAICRVGGRDDDFNLRTASLEPIDRGEALERLALVRAHSAERWGSNIEFHPQEPASSPRHTVLHGEVRSSSIPSSRGTRGDNQRFTAAEMQVRRSASATPSQATRLDKPALDYLQHIAQEPFLSVRERNAALRLSAWKGQRFKKDLLTKGLIREVAVNPGGRGERFKLLELTPPGRQLLADFGVEARQGLGRGGLLHQWWTDRVAGWLEEQDVPVNVEDDSQGARVDLAFSVRRKRFAVEVEISEGHVVENIRKDLEAGFTKVVSLLDETISKETIEKTVIERWGTTPQEIVIDYLPHHEDALAPLLIPHPPPLRRPNQDEEPSRPRRRRRPQSAPTLNLGRAACNSLPGVLTTPEAADYVGLSPATLETMRTRGGGPIFAKLGARVVYERDDLDRWLSERKRASTSDPGREL